MKIESIGDVSGIDFPGKSGPIIFTKGCNYRCGFCYNTSDRQVSPEKVESFLRGLELKARGGWYNGVTICGGEPTLQHDLPEFIQRLKNIGLAVKLDTNGSRYQELGRLKGIVDYAAMDVKGPFRLYADIAGVDFIDERDGITKAMGIVADFPGHEFRTTICPIAREDGEVTFMTPEEIEETAHFIFQNLPNNDSPYFLQQFVPVKGRLVDRRFEEMGETPKEILEEGCELAKKYLPNTKVRAR
ncbi:MAG: anaerobic ribonucleoside-triphosphate reductase activating protein [archaeon]|jgi:pyruvate formate lyase activating enzyme|nr:anaerobic ribonucleoside-triphosphate reductase activating protein [archaeon]